MVVDAKVARVSVVGVVGGAHKSPVRRSGGARGTRRGRLLAAIALAAGTVGTGVAFGQVNAIWNPISTNGAVENGSSWIGGQAPNNGTASFLGALNSPVTVSVSQANPLTSVVVSSNQTYTLTNTGAGALTFPASGSVFNVNRTRLGTEFFFDPGFILNNVQLSGGPFIKNGAGTLVINNTATFSNVFTGGVFLNAGVVAVSGGSANLSYDPADPNPASKVLTFNGGTLRVDGGSFSNSSRVVQISAGGGTIDTVQSIFSSPTSFGAQSWTGTGPLTKLGGGVIRVEGNNPFSGNVFVREGNFDLFLGTGAMTNVATFDVASALRLNPDTSISTTSTQNRVGDTATVRLRGGDLWLYGARNADNRETIGTLESSAGTSMVTVLPSTVVASGSPVAPRPTVLTAANLTRSNNGVFLIRAAGLTGGTADELGQVYVTNAVPLIGGGGAAGSTNISILPFAIGLGQISTTSFYTNGSFLTREASGRLRSLTLAEYATSVTAGATNNVRTSGTVTVPGGGATVNSLYLAGGGTVSGGPLTLTSGALYADNGTATITAPLVLPAGGEGVLLLAAAATTSGPISGNASLTKAFNGTWTITNSDSTYTGRTTLLGGQTLFTGDLPVNAPSPLGQTAQPIVLAAGQSRAPAAFPFPTVLEGQVNSTIARDLSIVGNGAGQVVLRTADGDVGMTLNGQITLERQLDLAFGFLDDGTSVATGAVFNGKITGTGSLRGVPEYFSKQQFNGPNDFSGGVYAASGTWIAGSDSAFGTGRITIDPTQELFTENLYVPTFIAANGPRVLPNSLVVSLAVQFAGSNPLTFNGTTDLTGREVEFRTQDADTVVTLGGTVGFGSLIKTGPGRLVLANTATLDQVVLFEGVLDIGNGGAAGAIVTTADIQFGDFNADTLGVLRFNRSATTVVTNRLLGFGGIAQIGSGTTILTASNPYNQGTTISAGTLQVGNNTTTGTIGTGDVLNNATLAFARSNNASFNNNISGTGAVEQRSASTLQLTGDTTYTGDTRVTAANGRIEFSRSVLSGTTGVLRLNAANASVALKAPSSSSEYVVAGQFGGISATATGTRVTLEPTDRTNGQKPRVLVTGNLSLAPSGATFGGFVDLQNNDMVVRDAAGANVAALRAMVKAWYNNGAPVQQGIGSLFGNTGTTAGFTTLAVFPNLIRNNIGYYDTYDGITLGALDAVVKYTWFGDTNIDGVLDASDRAKIIEGLTTGATGWQNGDLNYDGIVNVADLQKFDAVFAAIGSQSLGNGTGAASAGGGSIPEPTSAALLLAAAPLLTRRRR